MSQLSSDCIPWAAEIGPSIGPDIGEAARAACRPEGALYPAWAEWTRRICLISSGATWWVRLMPTVLTLWLGQFAPLFTFAVVCMSPLAKWISTVRLSFPPRRSSLPVVMRRLSIPTVQLPVGFSNVPDGGRSKTPLFGAVTCAYAATANAPLINTCLPNCTHLGDFVFFIGVLLAVFCTATFEIRQEFCRVKGNTNETEVTR